MHLGGCVRMNRTSELKWKKLALAHKRHIIDRNWFASVLAAAAAAAAGNAGMSTHSGVARCIALTTLARYKAV